MTYRGHVKNGVVVLDDAVNLPEGSRVGVQLLEDAPAPAEPDRIPSLYERLKPLIGKAESLPPDASVNLDHYLDGLPKRK
jgi:hypothetical protein